MQKLTLFFASYILANSLFAQDEQIKPMEILISGGRVPVSRDHVGTSTTVIDSEQIQRKGYQFVSDILKDTPGINVIDSGGPGGLSEVRIRGAESDQTLVLIDGIEANDPASSSRYDFAHLLAENIERIEVLRGAQSALWGSDAIGGVINIITKSGSGLEKPVHSVNAEYGSFNSKSFALGTRGDTGKFDYAFSLQRYESDGFSSASEKTFTYNTDSGQITTGGNSEDDAYENTTAHLKIAYQATENLTFDGVYRYTDYESEFDSFTTIPTDGTEERADTDQQYYLLQGRYSMLDNRLRHRLKYFRNKSDAQFFSSFGVTDSDGEKDHIGYQLDYEFNTVEAQHGVSFALETEEDQLNSTFSGKRQVENDSAVSEYRFKKDDFAASANLRYDDNDIFDNETTWRLAASWRFNPTTRLHTSYGTGIKNPTLIELFGFTPDFTGNENLEAEKSKGGDIGIEIKSEDNRHLLDLTYFDRDIENLITGAGNTAINIDGESQSKGIELSYDGNLTDHIDLQLSYTYNDTKDNQGKQLIRRPKHQYFASLGYHNLSETLNVNLNLRHVSDVKDIVFNEDFSTSNVDLDDYTVVGASASYSITDSLKLKARIENLLDEEYEEILGYGTSQRAYYIGVSGDF